MQNNRYLYLLSLNKYVPFLVTALLLCVILLGIFPYYRFFVDPDATAYLTISSRYAAGDIQRAINGYWSPWSCWLTAILIAQGIAPFVSAIIINALGAIGFLGISHSLFRKYDVTVRMQWMFGMALAVFLSYAVFRQSFDDIWECFFLLAVLRIMLSAKFVHNPMLWIAAGIVGALAYFAKAYAFPFFILNMVVCAYYISKSYKGGGIRRWLEICAVSIGVMILFSLPWIYLLYAKYGMWTTSTAGTLNMSWYLVGHPYFKPGIIQLIPPVYPDAVSYWEDPWKANGITPHFWDSARLFGLQVLKAAYNMLKLLLSMSEISAFFLPIFLLCLSIVFNKQIRLFFGQKMLIPVISFLLFPLGYVLINFEARYIWYMLPLSMLIASSAMYRLWPVSRLPMKRMVSAFLVISFMIYPVYDMALMFRDGEVEYQKAQILKQLGIKGSYAANTTFGDKNYIATQQLAYFSGCNFYQVKDAYVPYGTLLYDLRRYHVKYFFYYYDDKDNAYIMKDEHGKPFPMIAELGDMKIFRLTR